MNRYIFFGFLLVFWSGVLNQESWTGAIGIAPLPTFDSIHENYIETILVKKSVLSKKATMLIPMEFVLMNQNTIAKKYPMEGHRPSEVYTNQGGTINVALNHTKNTAKESDLEAVKKIMDAQFNQPSVEFIKSEIKEFDGKKYIVIEFVSRAVDTKIYNLMAITSLENRLAMITFNCTDNHRKEWVSTGKKIIGSIHILQ